MLVTKKAIGERGSWFAKVDGERLPCVHRYWWTGRHGYFDPGLRLEDKKSQDLVAAIRTGKGVILRDSKRIEKNDGSIEFESHGYVAVWAVDDVVFDATGLRFTFVDRLMDLA